MDQFVGFLEFKTTTGTPDKIQVALRSLAATCPAGSTAATPLLSTAYGSDWRGTDFNTLSTPDVANNDEYKPISPLCTTDCDETYILANNKVQCVKVTVKYYFPMNKADTSLSPSPVIPTPDDINIGYRAYQIGAGWNLYKQTAGVASLTNVATSVTTSTNYFKSSNPSVSTFPA